MKHTKKMKQKKNSASKKEDGLDPISKSVIIRPPSISKQVQITKITRFEQTPKTLTWSSSATVVNGWTFRLANVPNYSELVATYDYYRISRIDVIFYPQNLTGPPSGTSIAGGIPVVWFTPDWSDESATLASVAEHQLVTVKPAYQQWEFSFVPRAASLVYQSGGIVSGYALTPPKGWFHTESATIEHYGLKTALSQTASGAVATGVMYFRYHVDFMVGR